jgi:hypothetical protein
VQPVILIRHPAAFASSLRRVDWPFPFSDFLEQTLLMRDYLMPFRAEVAAYAAVEHDLLDQAALLWRIIHHVIDIFRRRHPDWIYVRHEDLSSHPLDAFHELFGALDLDFGPRSEAFVQSHTASSNPVDAALGQVELLARDSRSNIQSWKRALSAGEVERLRTQVADVAPRFYQDDDW